MESDWQKKVTRARPLKFTLASGSCLLSLFPYPPPGKQTATIWPCQHMSPPCTKLQYPTLPTMMNLILQSQGLKQILPQDVAVRGLIKAKRKEPDAVGMPWRRCPKRLELELMDKWWRQPSPSWMGIIQSLEDIKLTKDQRKGKFSQYIHFLYISIFSCTQKFPGSLTFKPKISYAPGFFWDMLIPIITWTDNYSFVTQLCIWSCKAARFHDELSSWIILVMILLTRYMFVV